jgi:predicted transcriptional regulator
MSGKESLSLDEFATAPRRQRPAAVVDSRRAVGERAAVTEAASEPMAGEEDQGKGSASGEASKALRQVKRARMKGASHFVNVNLDRETKRRLKLASFNTDTSMQSIMEKAIRQYLDANGY